MRYAILLGKKAQTISADNPYVGCVIVKNGAKIGEGFTQAPGKAHAEIMAIRDAEKTLSTLAPSEHNFDDVTLYSTVEPCSFYGRTPACTEALLKKSIPNVVIGIRDPHYRVNGAGIRLLKEGGIQVKEGVCEPEVRDYLKGWLEQKRLENEKAVKRTQES